MFEISFVNNKYENTDIPWQRETFEPVVRPCLDELEM